MSSRILLGIVFFLRPLYILSASNSWVSNKASLLEYIAAAGDGGSIEIGGVEWFPRKNLTMSSRILFGIVFFLRLFYILSASNIWVSNKASLLKYIAAGDGGFIGVGGVE